MEKKIKILDCTLRDGAYIVDGNFGNIAIKGIIKKLQDANIDIIECGWLKNAKHVQGFSYYNKPDDLKQYIEKKENITYVAMIDYDRYDVSNLPMYDGKSIDAIRVVFPYGKADEGIEVGKLIKDKGYKVFIQVANTLAYSNEDLSGLAKAINILEPVGLSIVDTFGAMYEEDLERIVNILDSELRECIQLGFHSHNNQQLSFALTMSFVKMLLNSNRDIIIDSSLCGMGRGAGNTATELVCNYMNNKHYGNYDMDIIMDTIDIYMSSFLENYSWGYSIPYFIAGMYCCHVNNIAYLLRSHRTNARDMRSIIESLPKADRKRYDYDLLETKYMANQNRLVEDELIMDRLKKEFKNKSILLIAPGKSTLTMKDKIHKYIKDIKPIVIAVNALNEYYRFDYLFLISSVRYEYAKSVYAKQFFDTKKILLSCIKTNPCDDELIINFNRVVKYGWEYFDNAVINCLRLLDKLGVENIAIAGFDEFKDKYNETYADEALPTVNPNNNWSGLNKEIIQMYVEFKKKKKFIKNIEFITDSMFDI